MVTLTKNEWLVLKHISDEDRTPVDVVEGEAFQHLLGLGMVEVHGEATWLTDYGWEVITDARDNERDAGEIASMSWSD